MGPSQTFSRIRNKLGSKKCNTHAYTTPGRLYLEPPSSNEVPWQSGHASRAPKAMRSASLSRTAFSPPWLDCSFHSSSILFFVQFTGVYASQLITLKQYSVFVQFTGVYPSPIYDQQQKAPSPCTEKVVALILTAYTSEGGGCRCKNRKLRTIT